MGRTKNTTKARAEVAAVGRQNLQNRHERIKDSLREELAKKVGQLETVHAEKETIKKEIEESLKKNKFISDEIRAKNDLNTILRTELSEKDLKIEFYDQQLHSIRCENMELKTKLDTVGKESEFPKRKSTEVVKVAVRNERETMKIVYEKKVADLEAKMKELAASTPSALRMLQKFDNLTTNAGRNNRCKFMLAHLKKTVGEEGFDEFLSYFCRYIARDKNYSFKFALSEMDSFFATVKWKFSDCFLKEFKAFLTKRLGFDIFCSREKIDNLRNLHSGLESYNITVESIKKKVGSREVELDSAIIEAKNVTELLVRRLERLHANGQLRIGDDGCIHIGFGGDKGGKHTKVVIVLGNVENPNNPHGILLLGMYEGDDNYNSLKKNLSSVFAMVNDLHEITYQEGGKQVTRKVIKLPIGDCKYISSVIGHSGQSCSTPCFLCKLEWVNHGQNTARLGSFPVSEIGDLYSAADLKPPLLVTPPEFIGPPGIHTILGITQSYVLNWLFALCNTVDCDEYMPEDIKKQGRILQDLHDELEFYSIRYTSSNSVLTTVSKLIEIVDNSLKSGRRKISHHSPCGSSFCIIAASKKTQFSNPQQFCCSSCRKVVHAACSLKVDTEEVQQLNESPAECIECQLKSTLSIQDVRDLLIKIQENAQKQFDSDQNLLEDVSEEYEKLEGCLNKSKGPTRKALEAVLRSIGCDYRAWYQQLTGNQAQRLLRPENISKLLAVFPADCSDSLPLMDLVMNDLGRLMSCANNEFKSDEQIDEIQEIICRFEANLKEAQPLATVTPKLHLLCAHLVPFLKVNRSWGHVTEQGLESLHAVINSLIIRFASVRNVEKNAESILKHIGNFNFLYDLGESWFNNI